MIGIIGTFLANIANIAFPKGNKSEKFVRGTPIKEVSVHMRTPKFYEAYASVCAKVQVFVNPYEDPGDIVSSLVEAKASRELKVAKIPQIRFK